MTIAPPRAQPITVLLAEDNPGDARLILEMLRDVEADLFKLELVDRLEPALDRLSRAGVDVVLLDLGLPDSQGLETFRRARRGTDEPIIVISGLGDEEVALEAVRSGAQDYLVKGRIEGQLLARVIKYAIERQRSERALADAAARLKGLMDNASDGISVLSAEGVVLEVNRSMAAILGLPADHVTGHHISEFASPDQADVSVKSFREAVEHGGGNISNVPLRRPDGKSVLVDFSLGVVDLHGKRLVLSIGRDVTERRSLEEQLRQAQKMEAIGLLAGGVAHDFNNVLTAIFGYADLMALECSTDDPRLADIEEIRKAAQRAAGLTRQLLAFSRKQVLEPAVLNLNNLVQDLEKLLQRMIGEDVELRVATVPGLGNVRADPGQVEQVIMNLAVNARDAMPRGGKLLIETANVDLGESYIETHHPVTPGPYVMLAVTDTGTGMDPITLARIFEPFFTTKEKGKGTGLGLSTVYGIVKQSGGFVWPYSEVGRGSTFKVYLPRVDAPVQAPARRERAGSLKGTETILLAEDDEALRPLVKGLLEKLGYRVLVAGSADEALAVAGRHHGAIPLLVADVVMPGGSGRDLARQLAAVRPETRVLYVSGYTDDAIVRHGMLEPGLAFLQKPFTRETLGRKVRDVLDAK